MAEPSEFDNPFILNTLMTIARTASPGFARWILKQADRLRGGLVPLNDNQVKMMHNLEQIFGDTMTSEEYKKTALRCFYLRSLAVYDYYHHVNSVKALRDRIHLTDGAKAFVNYFKDQKNGAVAVSPHFVASDIVGMELAHRIEKTQAFSIANPTLSYKNENKIREAYGINVTPASAHALQEAAQTIRSGGLMALGTERAHQEEQYEVHFFGQPARLPTIHTRLALRLKVPIFHFTGTMNEDMEYFLDASEPIWPDSYPTHEEDIVNNTEKVLKYTEAVIRKNPEQWGMFHPVWNSIIESRKD